MIIKQHRESRPRSANKTDQVPKRGWEDPCVSEERKGKEKKRKKEREGKGKEKICKIVYKLQCFNAGWCPRRIATEYHQRGVAARDPYSYLHRKLRQ